MPSVQCSGGTTSIYRMAGLSGEYRSQWMDVCVGGVPHLNKYKAIAFHMNFVRNNMAKYLYDVAK